MDSTPFLDQLSPSQDDQELRVNELLDACSAGAVYGRHASTSTGLVFGYYGGPGPFNSTAIANGTITCGASTTTYVVVARATGAVSASTSTTNWNDDTNYARLYSLVSGGSAITSYEDHRMRAGGVLATPNGGTTGGGASSTQTGEMICGYIGTVADKTYKLVVKAAHAGTITEATTISESGTCTATFKINTTALGGTANSVSTSESSQAHASANAFSAGDDIQLTTSSNSACLGLSFTLTYTREYDE